MRKVTVSRIRKGYAHTVLTFRITYVDNSKKLLKFTLKFTLKCSYVFRFNNHHQAAYCCALLKLQLLKRCCESFLSCGCSHTTERIHAIKATKYNNFFKCIFVKSSTCFGQFLCPSSGVQHCTHSNQHNLYDIPLPMCTVLDS